MDVIYFMKGMTNSFGESIFCVINVCVCVCHKIIVQLRTKTYFSKVYFCKEYLADASSNSKGRCQKPPARKLSVERGGGTPLFR